jgi:hypothetical protein
MSWDFREVSTKTRLLKVAEIALLIFVGLCCFSGLGAYQIGSAKLGPWSILEAGLVSSYFALQATRARLQVEAIAGDILRPVRQHF